MSATVTLEPWGSGDLPLLERLMGDPRTTEQLGGPERPDKQRERQGRYERLEGGDRLFELLDLENGVGVGGFTLADLVSYNQKHNEANGENNRDGTEDNRWWNCGAEGPTHEPGILALRARQRRNLLATLLLSQGVPMLLSGDEIGRTQCGNNNAYCQDNEISWHDWDAVDEELLAFVRELVRFRLRHPIFHRARFFQGNPVRGAAVTDIAWFRPDGQQMTDGDWNVGLRALTRGVPQRRGHPRSRPARSAGE